jgi:hypothetical protein
MLCRVVLVRTDVLEEPSPSFIGVTRIGELEVLEDTILNSKHHENLKS